MTELYKLNLEKRNEKHTIQHKRDNFLPFSFVN
jgi:hypothetical protein